MYRVRPELCSIFFKKMKKYSSLVLTMENVDFPFEPSILTLILIQLPSSLAGPKHTRPLPNERDELGSAEWAARRDRVTCVGA
jgi:hypothetical protein